MKRKKKVKRFECTICGECCTGFNIVIDPWVEDGVVHLVKEGSIGVEIWPFEARLFAPLSEEGDKGLVLQPSNLMFDKERENAVALSYFIANSECPFLEGERCSVHKARPIVCRYFPLVLGPTGLRLSTRCPETVRPKMRSSGKANADAIRAAYGDFVTYLLRDCAMHEKVVNLVGKLELEGHVKWDWKPDPDLVLEKVQDQEWKDIFEYIVEIGYMTSDEAWKLIHDIISTDEAAEKVDLRLLAL